jgi:CheY-like chemotaxis protein
MDDRAFDAYRKVSRVVAASQLIGLLAVTLFAAQAGTFGAFASVVGVGLMVAASAFAVGGLIGFVFGIPRSLQEPTATVPEHTDGDEEGSDEALRRVRYSGNTSLEQISDWLTKILVGVGLTQLSNIPSALGALGTVLAPGLGGFPSSATVGPLGVIFFGIGGFFLSYLWTRLYLASLLVESDEEARRAAERELELRAIEVTAGLQEAASASRGSPTPAGTIPEDRRRVLWVDDRPSNNRREINQLETQGIHVTTKTSTEDALDELSSNAERYGLVISDMGRGLDRRAGYTLLKAMRDQGIDTPLVIYAGSGSPEHDAEARERGALGSTNSPVRLFELVRNALR